LPVLGVEGCTVKFLSASSGETARNRGSEMV
jgi:hypothetical protein